MKIERSTFHFLTYSLWGVLALSFLSGIFLLVYYVPSFSQAFLSLQKINDQVPFGWMFRRIHGAGGSFLLILLGIHLARVFYSGDYKDRPGYAWVIEVLLVAAAFGANFTGFFLPLSQEALWGTAATLSSLSTLPWIGGFLVEFLRGGKELGGPALARFLSAHLGLAALVFLLVTARVRGRLSRTGVVDQDAPSRSGSRTAPAPGQTENGLPLNLWTSGVVAAALFSIITFAPQAFLDPLRQAANPTVNPASVSAPWYLLFLQETFSFLNSTYPAWSVLLSLVVAVLIFLLPYLDRGLEKKFLLRPVSLSIGSALAVVLVYFTFLGIAGAHYGEKVVMPADKGSAAEIRGARVFAQKNCAYCHQVFGREGRREGPDMSVVLQRKRTAEWIQRFVMNSRLYQSGTTMPKYDMPLDDLEALSAYLLSLDPKKRTFQTVDREFLTGFDPLSKLEAK